MDHQANKNGAAKPMGGTVAADVVQVEPGSQVVVVRAGEEEVPSADQIRAQTDQLATVLAAGPEGSRGRPSALEREVDGRSGASQR